MKVLQFIAHPDISDKSFTQSLAKSFRLGCEASGHDVTVINLYAAAVPTATELQAMVLEADHLCFAWPCWWEMPPAKMVDVLQTVFVRGFAFDSDGDRMVPKFIKTATVIISMGQLKNYDTTNLREAMTYCGLIPSFHIFNNVGPRLTPEMADIYLNTARRAGERLF